MVRELTPDDARTKQLFHLVGGLPNMNLWTDSGGETHDLDYKHDMKRMFAIQTLWNIL
jgi:hypothetical protein